MADLDVVEDFGPGDYRFVEEVRGDRDQLIEGNT